jgi:hypothetical protein
MIYYLSENFKSIFIFNLKLKLLFFFLKNYYNYKDIL